MKIFDLLLDGYGPQGWWPLGGRYFPSYHDPFEVAVGAVLTQNTSWANASAALEALRRAKLIDPERMLGIDRTGLARIIHSSGYHNQKADRLRTLSRLFIEIGPSWRIPDREELMSLRGIGPETADSILLYAFHVAVFVIDAYTKRLFSRAGLARDRSSYGELQALFMSALPRDHMLFNEYHALIVSHCKARCRSEPLCGVCVLAGEGVCARAP